MSGDWIKMRACLLTDPKVMAIARHLETHTQFSRWFTCGEHDKAVICDTALRYTVTGALHNVWCNANEHCDEVGDGDVVSGADLLWIDAVSGIQGFGSAMLSVGWVEVLDVGVRFPKFNRHNTSGAERQKRYRDKKAVNRDSERNKRNVTRNVTNGVTSDARVTHREEKSIEEGESPCTLPKSLDTEKFRFAWKEFLEHLRHKTGQAMSVQWIEVNLMECCRRGVDKAVRDIRFSIEKNAKTLLDGSVRYDGKDGNSDGKPKMNITERKAYEMSMALEARAKQAETTNAS